MIASALRKIIETKQSLRASLCLKGLFAFVVLAGFSGQARALGPSILNFQANAIYVDSTVGGSTLSGQIAWTPYLGLGPIGIRGDIGVTVLRQHQLDELYLATNYEALLSLSFLPGFSVEGGGGFHTWHGHGGTDLALTGNLVFTMVPMVDRIFVGFTRCFIGQGSNQIRAGFGFTL